MKKISAKKFDEMFEKGKDIADYLDTSNTVSAKEFKESLEIKRVNIDFPVRIVNKLDIEAKKIGVTRQSLIKMWIAEKLSETEIR